MSDSIRNKIRPMPNGRLFETGWAGKLTFEQIAEQVSPKVSWKLKSYGLYGQDIPDSIQTAIDELLRFAGPSHITLEQWAYQDVTLRDKTIQQGDIVHAVLFSANRDPQIFNHPHELDIRRTPNKHIAFSHGIHHCLGAALARLEGDIALTTLLRRMPNL